ncbi:MAG TPA: chloride channel protein [Candidatus Acidoferrum sp.]|nr:chloride channel protein [Candidatus Acidoferrum sp.]
MDDNGGTSPAPIWRKPARWWAGLSAQREERLLLILSILIGALTGLAVVAFILLTERLGMRLYPVGSAAWRRILIPVLGSIGMGYLLFRYFPDARGSGVPQTKAALYAREGVITGGTIFGKFFCTSATLASGIPLGREGPSVQVGAGIASILARRLGLRPRNVQALIPAGAAAAIAAAFNTPLAGVIFSLEEIIGDLHAPVLGSVVLASATSWLVLRMLLGNNPLFQVPQYQLVHPVEFAIYAVLGLLGGLVSVAFTKLLLGMRAWFLHLPLPTRWIQPVAGGLLVGLMGWWVPQVLGVGYGYVGDALNGRMALRLMALLVVLKLLTVTVSYASGNAGGIFGPSLFIGAMVGGVLGSVAHHLWPAYTALPGAYALVGMGTLFAGILRAPMTSVLMIFETTHDYAVIVPLMISNLVSFFISSRLQHEPIYEVLAQQDGVHLPSEATRQRRGLNPVADVMRPASETLRADSTVREVLETKKESGIHAWPVTDSRGVIGMVSLAELQQAASGEGSRTLADLIPSLDFPHVHPDHPLDLALERMGATKLDLLPVVSRADTHQLLGIVTLADILKAFGLNQQTEPSV